MRRVQWSTSPNAPREWQREAVAASIQRINHEGVQTGIISAVMGAGKSQVIGELCATYSGTDRGIVVVTTPTQQLVEQLYDTVSKFVGGKCCMFYQHSKSVDADVVITTQQSAQSVAERLQDNGRKVRLWIADEAHKTENSLMKQVSSALNPARAIGMTATPFRASDKEFLSLWNVLLYEYSYQQAIKDKVIVPPKVIPYTGPEHDNIDSVCLNMIESVVRTGPGIANASSIREADSFAQYLTDNGIDAMSIHSKMGKKDRNRRIEMLRSGDIRCLVHVDMLSEGSDFPWLRWICLRRPVKSKVRFNQELGRVLRGWPDKTHGIVLDPNDLFNAFGMTNDYEAMLAGGLVLNSKSDAEDAADAVQLVLKEIREASDDVKVKTQFIAKALPAVTAWIRIVHLGLKVHGYIEPKTFKNSKWRDDFSTYNQSRILSEFCSFFEKIEMPQNHSLAARAAIKIGMRGELSKGDASDMISICFALSKNRNKWPNEIDEVDE
jgi:late competence protein required for DNA uptake (superfamily II DNA/RNA helicase)